MMLAVKVRTDAQEDAPRRRGFSVCRDVVSLARVNARRCALGPNAISINELLYLEAILCVNVQMNAPYADRFPQERLAIIVKPIRVTVYGLLDASNESRVVARCCCALPCG
jgi:hypothetical protein